MSNFIDTWKFLPGSIKFDAAKRRYLKKAKARLVTMSPLYPCGKPCSIGTHNEIVKKLTLFFVFIHRIMIESELRMSSPMSRNRVRFSELSY